MLIGLTAVSLDHVHLFIKIIFILLLLEQIIADVSVSHVINHERGHDLDTIHMLLHSEKDMGFLLRKVLSIFSCSPERSLRIKAGGLMRSTTYCKKSSKHPSRFTTPSNSFLSLNTLKHIALICLSSRMFRASV